MKEKYKYLILLTVVLILMIPLIIRDLPSLGMDAYAFVNFVYGIVPSLPPTTPILSTLIFGLLPSNLLVIWGILIVVFFTTLSIWKMIGELFSKKYGWLASLILISSPFFLNIFFRLEDDLFAMIPLSLAFYFGFKYKKIIEETGSGVLKCALLTLLFLIIAGMFWKFSIYYIFVFLLVTKFNPLFVIASLGSIFIFQEKLLYGILPSLVVSENYPIVGIAALGFLLIYFLKMFRTKDYEDWFVILLVFINLKFIFVAVPVLTVKVIQNIDYLIGKYGVRLIKLVVIGISVFIIVAGYNLLYATPSNDIDELFSIAYEVKETTNNKNPVLANWDFGYYFMFWDKTPKKFYGSPGNDIENYDGHIIVANKISRQGINCMQVYKNEIGRVLDCT